MANTNLSQVTYTYLPAIVSNTPAYFDSRVTFGGEGSPYDRYGSEIALLSDLDSDGVRDYAVGYAGYDGLAGADVGRVIIRSGVDGAELFSMEGAAKSDNFGTSVAGVGDLNGDGIGDIVVGSPGDDGGANGGGSVRVLSGADGAILYDKVENASYSFLGTAVTATGDVNGDGIDDFAAAAHSADGKGLTSNGRVDIYSGADGSVIHSIYGDYSGAYMGFRLSSVGDLDGDGVNELLVSASGGWLDGNHVQSGVELRSGANGDLMRRFAGDENTEHFGSAISNGGDLNGDGIDDFVITESAYNDTGGGEFHAYSGADFSKLYTVTGDAETHYRYWNPVSLADFDHDGTADLFITDANGHLRVLDGETREQIWYKQGWSHAGDLAAGDLNGDGYADLVIGSTESVNAEGRAWQFLSRPQLSVAEQSGPVALFSGQVGMIDNNLSEIYLPRLLVEISRNALPEVDTLSVMNTGDIELRHLDNIFYQGEQVGTIIGALDSPRLEIALNSNISEAALVALAQALSYEADGEVTERMLVGIEVSIIDGYGNHGYITRLEMERLSVNDATQVSGLAGDQAEYLIGGSSVALDVGADLQITDIDTQHFVDGQLLVTVADGAQPLEDQLFIVDNAEIQVQGSTVFWQGAEIATAGDGVQGTALEVNLNEQATPSAVSALLQAVHYVNQNPASLATGTRQLDVTLTDGAGGQVDVTSQVAMVRAPVIDLDSSAAGYGYVDFAADAVNGTAIASAAQISDDGEISTLTVQLFSRPDGVAEQLISSWGPGSVDIDGQHVEVGHFNALAGTLRFDFGEGADSSVVETVLAGVRYQNSDSDLTAGMRMIQVTAVDDEGHGSMAANAWLGVNGADLLW